MHQLKRTLLHLGFVSVVTATGLLAADEPPQKPKTVEELNPDLFAPKKIAPPSSTVVTNLVFDAMTKEYAAKPAETNAPFTFNITNAWTNEITIDRIKTSCGCTVAKLPSNPWHIAPGEHGQVNATMNLVGKAPGLASKTLTFHISVNGIYVGTRIATVRAIIPAPPAPTALSPEERKAAMQKAKSDARLIFTDPKCAECHVNPGRYLSGAELYAADCGICHDSPNRESSVPDLHALKVPTNLDYWNQIITDGKPNTMMPAFAESKGGPLDLKKIRSLAEYLDHTISQKASPNNTIHTAQ